MLPKRKTEIFEILQILREYWPNCSTVELPRRSNDVADRALVGLYLVAVQWLTDRGMISFEALSIQPSHILIRQAALTSRGRDLILGTMPFTAEDCEES
ncbi:MAG: hypothetical protein ABW048_09530 [Sphingobium sp.]